MPIDIVSIFVDENVGAGDCAFFFLDFECKFCLVLVFLGRADVLFLKAEDFVLHVCHHALDFLDVVLHLCGLDFDVHVGAFRVCVILGVSIGESAFRLANAVCYARVTCPPPCPHLVVAGVA